jgi:hypothetical protein
MAFALVPSMADAMHRVADLIGGTEIARGWALDRLYWREYDTVSRELRCYSDRELACDLRMSRSDVPELAAAEAQLRVDRFVQEHPEYRRAFGHHGHGHHRIAFG